MSAQLGEWVSKGLYRHRKRLLWVGLALLSGVAVAGWSAWSAQPAQASKTMPLPEGVPGVQPVSSPMPVSADDQALFQTVCQGPAARQLIQQARHNCERLLTHPTLAGQAHAVLAALMLDPPLQDMDRAVDHARQAVRLGNARGDFILALLTLAGHAQPWSFEQARDLLARAQGQGVAGASEYLERLAAQDECSAQASLKPLGVPLFCLYRAEVVQQLETRGMKHRSYRDDDWRDALSPGDAIGAQSVELLFDVDPAEHLPRLARMRYVFDMGPQGPLRWTELFDGLTQRYGRAQSAQRGEQAAWPMPDGTVVRLSRDGERCLVDYEHPKRLQQRDLNLARLRDGVRQARLLAEAHAL